MSFGAIIVLALGLAMDATAVAAARGLQAERVDVREALRVGLAFGAAQALMPLLGWGLGALLGAWIEAWDHWIAFALLTVLGLKLLRESFQRKDGESPEALTNAVLFGLAIATSIDAFAVGVTLPMLDAPLVSSVLTIGAITAVLSAAGLYAGRRFGALLGPRLGALGGLALIGLGVKILIEHLLAEAGG